MCRLNVLTAASHPEGSSQSEFLMGNAHGAKLAPWLSPGARSSQLVGEGFAPALPKRCDRMVALVERMVGLTKQKAVAPPSWRHRDEQGRLEAGATKLTPSHLERLEREITSTDAAIDELVYELYGIVGKERKIIEGG